MSSSTGSSQESAIVSQRRRLVAGYIAQRVSDAGMIARLVGGGVTEEEVAEDIRVLKSEWRKERRALLDEVGDATLRALDADEAQLRGMVQAARKEGNAKLSQVMKLMEMVRETQKLRLQLSGLLSSDGLQSFRAGTSGGGEGLEDGSFRVYEDELEGTGEEVGGV